MNGPGHYEISGIAYSGNGRISRVMVRPMAGRRGRSGAPGAGASRLLPASAAWRWNGGPGGPAKSRLGRSRQRATDSRRVRGRAGRDQEPVTNLLASPTQHYNSITSWGIGSDGEIKHVYA